MPSGRELGTVPDQDFAPETMPVGLDLAYPDAGIILGALENSRSCKVRLTSHDEGNVLKGDIAKLLPYIGVSSPYYLEAKHDYNPSAEERALGGLRSYVNSKRQGGLIVIHRVDYSGRFGNGRPLVARYLSDEVMGSPNAPAILVLGTGQPRYTEQSSGCELTPAQALLSKIACSYVLTGQGFARDSANRGGRVHTAVVGLHHENAQPAAESIPQGYLRVGTTPAFRRR